MRYLTDDDWDPTNWQQKAKAYTTLTYGELMPTSAKESAVGHDIAKWEFKDELGSTKGDPREMTDVVRLVATTSSQPEFKLPSSTVKTKSPEVMVWIFHSPDSYNGDKNRADHCKHYYALAKVSHAENKKKIPYRKDPITEVLLPEYERTIDPIFCPPGSFDI